MSNFLGPSLLMTRVLEELHFSHCTLSPEPIAVQFSHKKSVRTLFTNKTNRNRTELASPFNSFTTKVTENFVVQKKHKVRY